MTDGRSRGVRAWACHFKSSDDFKSSTTDAAPHATNIDQPNNLIEQSENQNPKNDAVSTINIANFKEDDEKQDTSSMKENELVDLQLIRVQTPPTPTPGPYGDFSSEGGISGGDESSGDGISGRGMGEVGFEGNRISGDGTGGNKISTQQISGDGEMEDQASGHKPMIFSNS